MSATGNAADRRPGGLAGLLADTMLLAGRSLRALGRDPAPIVFGMGQPVVFLLLFSAVMAEVIPLPGDADYVDFLAPGIAVQAAAYGALYTGAAMIADADAGLLDRFRSLPVARVAVLGGRAAADTGRVLLNVVVLVAVAHLIGFRFQGGVLPTLGFFGLAVAIGFTWTWLSIALGLAVGNQDGAQALMFLLFFVLLFLSATFVPPESMPAWLDAVAGVNPLTSFTEAMRALALGGPTAGPVLRSLAWTAGLSALLGALAVRAYRRA